MTDDELSQTASLGHKIKLLEDSVKSARDILSKREKDLADAKRELNALVNKIHGIQSDESAPDESSSATPSEPPSSSQPDLTQPASISTRINALLSAHPSKIYRLIDIVEHLSDCDPRSVRAAVARLSGNSASHVKLVRRGRYKWCA